MRFKLFLYLFLLFTGFAAVPASACESCAIPRLGRVDHCGLAPGKRPFFVDFTFEQQNWNTFDAHEAHELHEEGHHVHNKSHEEFIHFTAGVNPAENVTILADIPYVVRNSIEIEDHDRLGEKESSEGFGDLNLIGIWRFLRWEENFIGATAGVKFPTGSTDEENSQGILFEPELQPGSGSYDYPVGGVYQLRSGPFIFRGNAIYVIKTEGDHDFEYGGLFTTSLFIDYEAWKTQNGICAKIGVDLNFQHEDKQVHEGETIEDSGGSTLFLGPTLTVDVADRMSIFGTILFPVSQNLGGAHQELDFVWTAGAKVSW
ncbi:MAG: hypothetical protein ACREH5_02365 [Candidatus Omnitrophota bacterium]